MTIAGGALLCAGLMVFYVHAAGEHARRINVSKARGDQSGYLMDAEHVYHNWHDPHHNVLVGERNRMPVYAGFLALFYKPTMSDPEFFEVGRQANIYLSLVLLVAIGLLSRRNLPSHPAANLTAIAAFGWFIFKAGYTQSELLFYFLVFMTFLGMWHLFLDRVGWRTLLLAAVTGAVAGTAHLTKAATPPMLVIFLAIFAAEPLLSRDGTLEPQLPRGRRLAWRAAAATMFVIAFLTVLWPYISVNKQVFGQYFYNVNSTFYVWYDDWPSASVGVRLHGDGHQWPNVPASEIPSAGRYWREHTLAQIVERTRGGFADMATVSYRTYNFLWYLLLYAGVTAFVTVSRWRTATDVIRPRAWLALFIVGYVSAYALATAFYFPISGTGTARFFMALLLPIFFTLSAFLAHPRIAALEWHRGGQVWRLAHFHALVTLLLALDITFHVWPRLMSTYGGF